MPHHTLSHHTLPGTLLAALLVAFLHLTAMAADDGPPADIVAAWWFNQTNSAAPQAGSGTFRTQGGIRTDFAAGSPDDHSGPPNFSLALLGFPSRPPATNAQPGVLFDFDIPSTGQLRLAFDWYATATACRLMAVEISLNHAPFKTLALVEALRAGTFSNIQLRLPAGVSPTPAAASLRLSPHPGPGGTYEAVGSTAKFSTAGRWRLDRLWISIDGDGPNTPPGTPMFLPVSIEMVPGSRPRLRLQATPPPSFTILYSETPEGPYAPLPYDLLSGAPLPDSIHPHAGFFRITSP